MKKVLTICLFSLSIFSYAQEIIVTNSGKKVKLNSNNTWEFITDSNTEETDITSSDLTESAGFISTDILNPPIKLHKDGENNMAKVKTKFSAPIDKFNQTDFQRINLMYTISLNWAKNKLKNPYSFSPKEIDLSYDSTYDIWWCRIKYVAKNSYGGEVAGSNFFTYPMEKVYKPYSDDELLNLTSKRKKKEKK